MRTLALFAVLLLAGCDKAPTSSNQPQGVETKPNVAQTDDTPQTGEQPDAEAGDPDAEPGAESGGESLPGPPLPDGPRCDTDADCGADMLCEGVGCGANEGRCVARDRMCTRDLASYCGCDGRTFQNSGSCPGARFAYRGPCDPKLEDGEPCSDGRQCKSGTCVGDGLEGCSTGALGVCGSAACTKDLASFCGCNNVEFRASSTCPNRQFAYRGPCEEG